MPYKPPPSAIRVLAEVLQSVRPVPEGTLADLGLHPTSLPPLLRAGYLTKSGHVYRGEVCYRATEAARDLVDEVRWSQPPRRLGGEE